MLQMTLRDHMSGALQLHTDSAPAWKVFQYQGHLARIQDAGLGGVSSAVH